MPAAKDTLKGEGEGVLARERGGPTVQRTILPGMGKVVPLESAITAKILRRLNEEPGCWAVKLKGGSGQQRGLPDIIGCLYGRMFGLEVKRPGVGVVSESQRYVLLQMANGGAITAIVETVDDVLAVLDLE